MIAGEVIDDHVERFTAADPAQQFGAKQGADFPESLRAFRVRLRGHGAVDLPKRVFAGGGHAPGEEPTAIDVGP